METGAPMQEVTAESSDVEAQSSSSPTTTTNTTNTPNTHSSPAAAYSPAADGISTDPYAYPQTKGKYSMSGDIGPPCCYKRQVGRFYVCIDQKVDGVNVPCCMVGPCWPMMLMTMSLIVGAGALSSGIFGHYLVQSTDGILVLCCGLFLVLFTAVCFGCTACRNPGIYPRQLENTTGDMIWHEETASFRPRRGVMMDSETRVLAHKIDHFCPWTGTLIARDNMPCFQAFTSCLLCACLGVGAICIYGLIKATSP